MENELYIYHHGVKGQKWGIRRFQNRNGSLTSEGKRRYRSDRNKSGRSTDQNAVKEERNRQKKYIRNKRLITVGRRVVNRILEKKGSSIRISSANEAVAQYALAKKYVRDTFR